jgi:hypothetical protein
MEANTIVYLGSSSLMVSITCIFINEDEDKRVVEFVHRKPFQPCLIFVDKAKREKPLRDAFLS